MGQLMHINQMFAHGCIVLETAWKDGAKFQTTIQIDGDIINFIPDPRKIKDANALRKWAEAANQHSEALAKQLQTILKTVQRLPRGLAALGLIWMFYDLVPLVSLLTKPQQEPIVLLKIIRSHEGLVVGPLLMIVSKKLLSWILTFYRSRIGRKLRNKLEKTMRSGERQKRQD